MAERCSESNVVFGGVVICRWIFRRASLAAADGVQSGFPSP